VEHESARPAETSEGWAIRRVDGVIGVAVGLRLEIICGPDACRSGHGRRKMVFRLRIDFAADFLWQTVPMGGHLRAEGRPGVLLERGRERGYDEKTRGDCRSAKQGRLEHFTASGNASRGTGEGGCLVARLPEVQAHFGTPGSGHKRSAFELEIADEPYRSDRVFEISAGRDVEGVKGMCWEIFRRRGLPWRGVRRCATFVRACWDRCGIHGRFWSAMPIRCWPLLLFRALNAR